MHILITGAAGMIGRKLTARLAKDGTLNGRRIDTLTLTDIVALAAPAGFSGEAATTTSDLAEPGAAEKAIAKGRNRDTAYFSMLECEWPARKAAFERWLAPENFDGDGRQRVSLRMLNGSDSVPLP